MKQELFNRLAMRFGVLHVHTQRPDQAYMKVEQSDAVALITHCKQLEGFVHLSFFTAVDYPEENRFELKYMLRNYDMNLDLCISTDIPREKRDGRAEMDSIHHLWPAAITYEQELAEMYGIDFPGSPRIGENFVLEGWDDIPPMRRDFDTREYSEKTFYERPGRVTHDPREHMRRELYPSEAEKW